MLGDRYRVGAGPFGEVAPQLERPQKVFLHARARSGGQLTIPKGSSALFLLIRRSTPAARCCRKSSPSSPESSRHPFRISRRISCARQSPTRRTSGDLLALPTNGAGSCLLAAPALAARPRHPELSSTSSSRSGSAFARSCSIVSASATKPGTSSGRSRPCQARA